MCIEVNAWHFGKGERSFGLVTRLGCHEERRSWVLSRTTNSHGAIIDAITKEIIAIDLNTKAPFLASNMCHFPVPNHLYPTKCLHPKHCLVVPPYPHASRHSAV